MILSSNASFNINTLRFLCWVPKQRPLVVSWYHALNCEIESISNILAFGQNASSLCVSEEGEFQPSQRHTLHCAVSVGLLILSAIKMYPACIALHDTALKEAIPWALSVWLFFFFNEISHFYSFILYITIFFPAFLCACMHMTSIRWIKSNALIPSQTRPLHHERSEIPGVRKHVPLHVIQGDGKPRNNRICSTKLLFTQSPKSISCETIWIQQKKKKKNSFCPFFSIENNAVASNQIILKKKKLWLIHVAKDLTFCGQVSIKLHHVTENMIWDVVLLCPWCHIYCTICSRWDVYPQDYM